MSFVFIIAAVILLTGVIYYAVKSVIEPYWAILLLPIASYLGILGSLFKGAIVPITLFQIFLILAFLIFILHRIYKQDFQIKIIGLEAEFALFIMLIFLSLIYSPNRGEGLLYGFRFTVLLLMVYLVVNTVININQIRLLIVMIALISIFLGAMSVRQGLLDPQAVIWNFYSFGQKLASRATGTYEDPNIFATLFFLPIFFSVSLIMAEKQKIQYKILGTILFAIFFISVLSTFSRSAWVSIIISLFILSLLFKKYNILLILFFSGLAAILFVPLFQIVIVNLFNRFLDIFAGGSDLSSGVRIGLGVGALRMSLGSYLLGVGFRGFPEAFPMYFSPLKTFGIVEPHNLFYTILAELGLIGLLLYLLILWKVSSIAYQNFKKSVGTEEQVISATLMITFIAHLIFYQFYVEGMMDNIFWINVALIYSLNFYLKGKSTSAERPAIPEKS